METTEAVAQMRIWARGVFSNNHTRRAARKRVPLNVFLESPGKVELSVDCLDAGPLAELTEIAAEVGARRQRSFYGWAVVRALQAARNGRRAIRTPLPQNPFHADIVLPDRAADEREEQKQHAQELADAAHWLPRPGQEKNE